MRDSLIRKVCGRHVGPDWSSWTIRGLRTHVGSGVGHRQRTCAYAPSSSGLRELSRKVLRWRGRRRAGPSGECPMEVTDDTPLLSCLPNEAESGWSCLSMSISHARQPPGRKKHERKRNAHLRLRPACLRWRPTPSRCWVSMGAQLHHGGLGTAHRGSGRPYGPHGIVCMVQLAQGKRDEQRWGR
jgi:hypothetical protein